MKQPDRAIRKKRGQKTGDPPSPKCVISDPLKFKLRLHIGEDAYASLTTKKLLLEIIKTGKAAKVGAAVAGSAPVASTFFAPTGLLSVIGIGTATTPVGWLIAAAVVSGGLYVGATRVIQGRTKDLVEAIPKCINTPMDLLGASLFNLMGSLAVRVALADGRIDPTERLVIRNHFVSDWGFDPSYVDHGLIALEANTDDARITKLAHSISELLVENPDCNPTEMLAHLMSFLRDIAQADGTLGEREELALRVVEDIFREETELSFRNAGRTLASWRAKAGAAIRETAEKAGALMPARLARKTA